MSERLKPNDQSKIVIMLQPDRWEELVEADSVWRETYEKELENAVNGILLKHDLYTELDSVNVEVIPSQELVERNQAWGYFITDE